MWFHYSQNNSGGDFVYDAKSGITHHVVIEAKNASAADKRAETIGLYFDGCENEQDCDCCGDRWGRTYQDGTKYPAVYDRQVTATSTVDELAMHVKWIKGYEVFVHPLKGKFWGAAEK